MSRELERRLVKVETRRRVDGLRGLSDAELEARIAEGQQDVVAELRASIASGQSEAEVAAEVREVFARFPEAMASILANLGLLAEEVML